MFHFASPVSFFFFFFPLHSANGIRPDLQLSDEASFLFERGESERCAAMDPQWDAVDVESLIVVSGL